MEVLIIFLIFGASAWAFMSEKSDERKDREASQKLIKQRAFTEGQKSVSTKELKELQRIHEKEIQQLEVRTTDYLENLVEINEEKLASMKSEVARAELSNADEMEKLRGSVEELKRLVAFLEGAPESHDQKQQTIIKQDNKSEDLKEALPESILQNVLKDPDPNQTYLKKLEKKRQQKSKTQRLEAQRIEIQEYQRANYNRVRPRLTSSETSGLKQSVKQNLAKDQSLGLKLKKLNEANAENMFEERIEYNFSKLKMLCPAPIYHRECLSPYSVCGCPIPAVVKEKYQLDIQRYELEVEQFKEMRKLFHSLSVEKKKQWLEFSWNRIKVMDRTNEFGSKGG